MVPYKTELVQTSELTDNDIIIAFIGQSGSGKSQIIDTLTGEQRAAESYTSVTQDLEAIRILDHERYASHIVLVETPGFNHSEKPDEEILKLIREWLETTCEKRIVLSGMVYVERINDPTRPTSGNNLRMFAELTGRGSAKNVVLATTMWDILGSTFDDGSKREERLKKYWKGMNHRDADIERFLNNSGSAWSIVENVVKKNDQKARRNKDGFRSLVISILRSLPQSVKKSWNKPGL